MKEKKKNRRSSFAETLEQKICGLGITEMLIREMPSDAEKVSKIIKTSTKLFPSKAVEPDYDQKCAEKSLKLRKEGNVHHTEKRYKKALSLYTRSVAFAPPNSPTFCYALANRAALLKDMGHYADSIADTQRALKAGYPENNRYLLYLRQGVSYQKLGQPGKALKSFNTSMKALENQSSLNEDMKNQMRQNIKAELNHCHTEREEEFEDLTRDKTIGVLNFDVPSLGSKVNPEIPSASDCILLKYNETFGRHLVATRDIEPGMHIPGILNTVFFYHTCSSVTKLFYHGGYTVCIQHTDVKFHPFIFIFFFD